MEIKSNLENGKRIDNLVENPNWDVAGSWFKSLPVHVCYIIHAVLLKRNYHSVFKSNPCRKANDYLMSNAF